MGLALAFALVCGQDVGQWQVPNAWSNSEENLLKMRRVGHYFYHLSNIIQVLDRNIASVSSQRSVSCPKAVHLSTWEIFVSKSSAVLFEN